MHDVLPHPSPTPVTLPEGSVCVLVLDLSLRCDAPEAVCREVVPAVRGLLDAARARGVPIAFTVSRSARGSDEDGVATGLGREAGEPVFHPDHFDKLADPDLLGFVRSTGASGVVVCGSSSNNCVMYTVTSAARVHGLEVFVPVDCVNARTDYQQGYALYQMTHLPGTSTEPVTLTRSGDLVFV